ncbi:NgoFVII family restriction endonuclease [Elizabethkingia anophelis]|uniref:phospholipase D-like domain-containing protein n=1 Tax=Elizabethkingia anophelis TaxID=1117645 RepID=UPI00136B57B3|nr:phospholipase D-like domain-containing protein [Elizabethkingia anophelis]MCT4228430.1 NgoFVII family restriction endonuclease [Elizabethkingia anophelis]MCT4239156.1 NgoFVII family restriction endonuclease [Elizabethkingia anophelis]MCT4282273.1 NgoFVII family restriction endonuclease [Elizabethkingia anophelis]MCT4292858.1 NgoFVII family restriction endonuclease [Elizabethkingia anophelis]MYY28154.1 NgoFVII family restriction endonuclease [Elizabethkingia anophelis]
MIIHTEIKQKLQVELLEAKSIWIATAMISYNGWKFIKENLSKDTEQHFLIGIDLATEPKVFEELLNKLHINSRVYQTNYTFHPKVYLLQKRDNSFTAFIGSSNTTIWGLEKNVEMNFLVNDQAECIKLLEWFNEHYSKGYIITEDFVDDYKSKYTRINIKKKGIISEIQQINSEVAQDSEQFFTRNEHKIFEERYHRINSSDLQRIRKRVSDKFKEIHKIIYPQFNSYGLSDLHCHHNLREIVSRHFFNSFSGNYINAMWLHYGKSYEQLQIYNEKSFINNIRLQVIIHKDSLGIWLVLGKNRGSVRDREYFREQMKNAFIRKRFFEAYKKLGNDYWMNIKGIPSVEDIKTPEELHIYTQKESIDDYFIIGNDIGWLDDRLSKTNIANTILQEFRKLYPLYEIMKNKS